ncbi:MAG TPA: chemotaxis protein CheW [Phycisphaerae bacterium]|nr:chemotaxis protein CheW [Phycisphaerae bacterium]
MLEQDDIEVVADAETTGAETASLGGKYLTFALAREEFGLEILQVREIIRVLDITRVPQTADFLRGVINLRGKVIPVIDLRCRFGLPKTDQTDETCIIVVDTGAQKLTGIIVDAVREVYDIQEENIEPPPEFGSTVDSTFLLGMGKVGDAIKILLDIRAVLEGEPFVRA